MSIAVYLPAASELKFAADDVAVQRYETPAALAVLLSQAQGSAAVIVSGDLTEDDQDVIAIAIRDYAVHAIEVRAERWDGFASSPLSAACRGVISGFGANGIPAAVDVLRKTFAAT